MSDSNFGTWMRATTRTRIPDAYQHAALEIIAGAGLIVVLSLGGQLAAGQMHIELWNPPSLGMLAKQGAWIPIIEYVALLLVTVAGAITAVALSFAGAFRLIRTVLTEDRRPVKRRPMSTEGE